VTLAAQLTQRLQACISFFIGPVATWIPEDDPATYDEVAFLNYRGADERGTLWWHQRVTRRQAQEELNRMARRRPPAATGAELYRDGVLISTLRPGDR